MVSPTSSRLRSLMDPIGWNSLFLLISLLVLSPFYYTNQYFILLVSFFLCYLLIFRLSLYLYYTEDLYNTIVCFFMCVFYVCCRISCFTGFMIVLCLWGCGSLSQLWLVSLYRRIPLFSLDSSSFLIGIFFFPWTKKN